MAKEGFDPVFGARPLRRTILRHIENPLSKKVLSGDFKEGDTVFVDVEDNGLVFYKGEVWHPVPTEAEAK